MSDLVRQTTAILRANAPRWGELATIDRELLTRPPEEGEWSALDCLWHATDTEGTIFATRVRGLMNGLPTMQKYDPDGPDVLKADARTDPAALVAQHAELRAKSLALLATVTEADLDRTAIHSELGVISLRDLLNEWAAHELMHIVQAERAIMQAFIPGTGPWRGYFIDHDVEMRAAERAGDGRLMDETAVRESAEAFGAALVAGDVDRAIEDFSQELHRNLGEVISLLPLPANEATVESIEHGASAYVVVFRLVGETDEIQLQTRWKDRDGRATIVEVSHLSQKALEGPAGEEGTEGEGESAEGE